MKKFLLKLLISASVFSVSTAFADPIKSIEILGLDSISRGTVLSYLPVEAGDDYNTQISGDIIRALYKTNFFKDIDVSQVDQILKIALKENPHIKRVEVLNYSDKVIDENSLKKILKSMDLYQGKIFNKSQLNKLITQIKESYIAKGYYSIDISKKIQIDAQNRVDIELDIDEGDVARISSMVISGSQVHSEEELLDLFEIGESDFFIKNYFTEKDHYSKIALDAGIEAMKSLYINAGYFDFTVDKVDTQLSEDKENIAIDIQINEGRQYKVGKIKFTGIPINQPIKALKDLLTVKTGDIFERQKVIKSVQEITSVFTDQGYAFAKINPITSEGVEPHLVDLNVEVTLNEKVYINRITITGNTRTQDEVIRREIGIYEGSLYSNAELDESVTRIRRLGFFSDVKMEVSKLEGFGDKINIHLSVTETKTGSFSIGLAHSSSSGATFELGIKEKNFLGSGNTLNAEISSAELSQTISFYFEDPYATKDGHSASYGIFLKENKGKASKSSYKISEKGGSIGYGIPLTKDTRLNADIQLSVRDITCGYEFGGTNGPEPQPDDTSKKDPDNFIGDGLETEQCANGDKNEVKANLSWSNNTLNNASFPTEGQKNKLSLDVALPIADFKYYQFDASHKSYFPLGRDLTFTLKADLGVAQGYGGKELPFFKRYYGGGSSSVRGFALNSLGATYKNGVAKGGELSMLGGTSIISPMKFITNSENMRMSAFIDMGAIGEKVSNISSKQIRMSAGLAFSWLTPVGPIGLYFATPLIKRAGDETKTFEFTLGNSF